MIRQSFDLVNEPWIKVLVKSSNEIHSVSLKQLFENTNEYRQLAGDTETQDLAILRFLLAILQTVYSRVAVTDQPYSWLTLNKSSWQVESIDESNYEPDDLEQTWNDLYRRKAFTTAVIDYLNAYQSRFDFFGEHPFYQATQIEYDSLVPVNKHVATGKGTVAIKQIDRGISESNNSPALFAPKTTAYKNSVTLPALIRWMITYQNFTGVTDKTKIETKDKFASSKGWLYSLSPVFINGRSLFEILLFNLVLVDSQSEEYVMQQPVWEYSNVMTYIEFRKQQLQPKNLAALYTTWTRLLHLEWSDAGQPVIFSAGIPMFDTDDLLLEPMTVWKTVKNDQKIDVRRPAVKSIKSLSKAMWRNFGDYVDVNHDGGDNQPGVVTWIRLMKKRHFIKAETLINLRAVAMISDGNATSQSPAAEWIDDMEISAAVLFDNDPRTAKFWPGRIEEVIDLTDRIGKAYRKFIQTISEIRNMTGNEFSVRESAKFYEQLNKPFKIWLSSLTNEDDRDEKIMSWQQILRSIVLHCADGLMSSATSRDRIGCVTTENRMSNIFTAYNRLVYSVNQELNQK